VLKNDGCRWGGWRRVEERGRWCRQEVPGAQLDKRRRGASPLKAASLYATQRNAVAERQINCSRRSWKEAKTKMPEERSLFSAVLSSGMNGEESMDADAVVTKSAVLFCSVLVSRGHR
jgi:hypothetical protein